MSDEIIVPLSSYGKVTIGTGEQSGPMQYMGRIVDHEGNVLKEAEEIPDEW